MQSKIKIILIRTLFTLVGFFSLIHLIKKYGFNIIIEEINRSGFLLVLLALTFIPTLFCYAVSWLMSTNHERMSGNLTLSKKMSLFVKYTTISIAWNNLTPFLKVGGEPLKYMMLNKHLSKSDAMASTINYNVIHLLATALSFFITSLCLILFYRLPTMVFYFLLALTVSFPVMFYLGYQMMRLRYFFISSKHQFRFVRYLSTNIKVSFRILTSFYKKQPKAFLISLLIDVVARFLEGMTFFFCFYLIKHPINILSSAFLDVGRTFIDTIFFFIPFQIGTREEGVRFFMEKILSVDSQGFLTAVFLYRFVEIVWIIIGYLIWVSAKSSSKDERV